MEKNNSAQQVSANENPVSVSEEKTLLLLSKALENKVMTGNARVLSRATLDACGVDPILWKERMLNMYSVSAHVALDMRADDKAETMQVSANTEALSKFWESWNDMLRFVSRGHKTRIRAYGTDLQFFVFAIRAFQREDKKTEEPTDGSAPVTPVRKQVFSFASFTRFRALVEWALGKRFLGEVLSEDEEAARKEASERAKLNDQLRKRAKKAPDKTPDKTPDK